MKLIPTYSGVFDTDKRTCLVILNGKLIPYVCNQFEPISIINLTNCDISKGLDLYMKEKIQNIEIDYQNIELMTNLLDSLNDFNTIIYSEDLKSIEFIIKNNLYGFKMSSVGLGTCINNNWGIKAWYEFVKNIEKEDKAHYPINLNVQPNNYDEIFNSSIPDIDFLDVLKQSTQEKPFYVIIPRNIDEAMFQKINDMTHNLIERALNDENCDNVYIAYVKR